MTYSHDDLVLLNCIGLQTAIAIENFFLIEEKVKSERMAAVGLAVTGISHYIKNILSGLKGASSLINTGLEDENLELVKEAWDVYSRSEAKINSLAQDLLIYSKKRAPELEEENLATLLKDLYSATIAKARGEGVELTIELDPALPNSFFDSDAIYDALLNLVINAIEACQETPEARIQIKAAYLSAGNQLAVTITDNGPGIPEQIQASIFEPFYSTKGAKGTGLGLAIARKIFEEHQGRLQVESEENKGTTFEAQLPIHPQKHFTAAQTQEDQL